METVMTEMEVLGQALIALVLGGVLGWEREQARKGAGFRTHMLVCLASMVFVRVGQFLLIESAQADHRAIVQADPMRLIEAIVTGIAFIGAGTVFRDPGKNIAQGLTTAATLLAVAPIGISVALGRYVLAIGLTVLVFIVLRFMTVIEERWIRKGEAVRTEE